MQLVCVGLLVAISTAESIHVLFLLQREPSSYALSWSVAKSPTFPAFPVEFERRTGASRAADVYLGGSWTNHRAARVTSPPAPSCSASSFAEETATQTQPHYRLTRPQTLKPVGSHLQRLTLFGYVSLQEEHRRCAILTPATASDCIAICFFPSRFI